MIGLFTLFVIGSAVAVSADRILNAKPRVAAEQPPPEEQTNQEEHSDGPTPEEQTDQALAISATSLGLSLAGMVVPPLGVLAIPGMLYVSLPIWRATWHELRVERRVTMSCIDSLIVPLGTLTGHVSAVAFGLTMMFTGARLLARTKAKSKDALLSIFEVGDGTVAWLMEDGTEGLVPIESLQLGDRVVLRAGATIPIDGQVVHGSAVVDQQTLTGEAQGVDKFVGDELFASTTVLAGEVIVEVMRTGEETIAARIAETLASSIHFTSQVQLRGQAMGDAAALPMLVLSACALPLVGASSALAILFAPLLSAIRLGVPISLLEHLRWAAEDAVLIRDGRVLELLEHVDTVVFDKTGTLTVDAMTVERVHVCAGWSADEVIRLAAACEQNQQHPLARAIREDARRRGLDVPSMDNAHYEVGLGLVGSVEDRELRIGSERFMEHAGVAMPDGLASALLASQLAGSSMVYLSVEDTIVAGIELQAVVREEALRTIEALGARGCEVIILSGDHRAPTEALGRRLGVDRVFAEVMPEDKAKVIEALAREGRVTCFVGDGINDGLALKAAHVSVSLAGASNVAIDTAQVLLMDARLDQLIDLFAIADGYDENMDGTIAAALIPSGLCIGGALLGQVGIVGAVGFFLISLGAGTLNAVRPGLVRSRAAEASA